MRIHLLKHSNVSTAENVFLQIAQAEDHEVLIVDPRDIAFMGETQLPDAVLARCELDSFVDPILADYLAAIHRYERFYVPVLNRSSFLIVGQDKYLSHLAVEKMLQRHPVERCSTPETIRVSRREDVAAMATSFFDRYGGVVVKPPCSGRGNGIFFVETRDQLARALTSYDPHEPVLLQQPILKESSTDGRLRDIRLWVIRDSVTNQARVIDAFYRVGARGNFLTNLLQGASIELMQDMDPHLRQFASAILETLGGDVAGVDIARDVSGRYWFEEVNVAFETSAQSLELLGDRIWREALALMEARASLKNPLLHLVEKEKEPA
ncbi:MAG: YheC/YheD family protein [Patescibacteria group bacterium]